MVSEVHDKSRDYRHHFMVSEVHDKSRDYKHHFIVSEVLDDPELYFKGTDTGFHSGFHCVILDLKDLLSHLF